MNQELFDNLRSGDEIFLYLICHEDPAGKEYCLHSGKTSISKLKEKTGSKVFVFDRPEIEVNEKYFHAMRLERGNRALELFLGITDNHTFIITENETDFNEYVNDYEKFMAENVD